MLHLCPGRALVPPGPLHARDAVSTAQPVLARLSLEARHAWHTLHSTQLYITQL